MMEYPCTKCGCCCKRVEAVISFCREVKNPELVFPYKADENGHCENLTKDNQCSVYENRPTVCNIEKMAKYFELDKETFFNINIAACNKMIYEDGVDEKYKIK